jgi:hypothetical protein
MHIMQSSALSGTDLLSTMSYTFMGQMSTHTASPSQASLIVIVGISFTYLMIRRFIRFKCFPRVESQPMLNLY